MLNVAGLNNNQTTTNLYVIEIRKSGHHLPARNTCEERRWKVFEKDIFRDNLLPCIGRK